ncbi:unnamed protein product [Ambrosiozyma monospora]|uniref:Unnamed protein product n=1 Tax=Ambrosiozyma monospora TaxID=43982 RepID=A0ACB5UA01_AMBMO|nr:unnamed protein product [Ambrosiozyma monospora]
MEYLYFYPDDTFSSKQFTEPNENQEEVYAITREFPMEVKLIVMKYVLVLNFNLLNDLLTVLGLIELNDFNINECLKLAIPYWYTIHYMPLLMEKCALIKDFAKSHDVRIHEVATSSFCPEYSEYYCPTWEKQLNSFQGYKETKLEKTYLRKCLNYFANTKVGFKLNCVVISLLRFHQDTSVSYHVWKNWFL